MVRWTMFGLDILYGYWLMWQIRLNVALFILSPYCHNDESQMTHVYLYMTMTLFSIHVMSSLRKVARHPYTTRASLLNISIRSAIDDP
jgi:hypothetical protein